MVSAGRSCLQEWVVKEASFKKVTRGGATSYNEGMLQEILITDEKHRHRSELAEQASAKGLASHPLPADAANGGRRQADPNSKPEMILTWSTVLLPHVYTLCGCGLYAVPA